MNQDELVWEIIYYGHCSFKAKLPEGETFCRNPYNVTGQCNRSACPLANSRYATLREDKGRIYLYVKTPERAHTPKFLWERIRLSKNYTKALEQVDQELQYFPKFLVHRNKQRLTKIHQFLVRSRKLSLKVKPKLVHVNPKVARREKKREAKALKAAKLERSIEGELLERLKTGVYGDIYNFPAASFNETLDEAEVEDEEEDEDESEDEEGEPAREFVEDFEWEEEDEEGEDLEDMSTNVAGLGGAAAGSSGLGGSVFSAAAPVGGAKRSREGPAKSVSFGAADDSGDEGAAPAPAPTKKPRKRSKRKHISLGGAAPVVEVEYETEEAGAQAARR